MALLAPSLLSADFADLAEDVKKVENAGAHLLHIDVMDGHFVPNISFGAAVMKSLLGKTEMPFDVHLMIENPDDYLEDFVTDNTEYITVHQEACIHIDRTLRHIRSQGVKAGVAVNPGTSMSVLDYVLDDVDMVLLMSVNPGFGGQKFIESSLGKVKELDRIKKKRGLDFKIEIDGGINLDNVKTVVDAGVEIIVAGSSVFEAQNIEGRVKGFLQRIK
ncbi:MAG: ribulose-phosphate 3-epimerase [Clostridiales bacterium]|nr:ribulose-phosphate 3-epimerase [Clostridiales bacterium]